MKTSPAEAVAITAADGVSLRGLRWPGADAWAVLLHDHGEGEDLDRWAPLAPALAARGWTVLAVDLRGHGGSDGVWDSARAESDLAVLVEFAHSGGAVFVAVVSAGEVAMLALRTAAATRPDALILLSPPLAPEQPLTDLRGAGEAKLILIGGGDAAIRAGAERLLAAAIGWVLLVNLPATAQGTALLRSDVATHLREQIVGFLNERRFLAGAATRQPSASVSGSETG